MQTAVKIVNLKTTNMKFIESSKFFLRVVVFDFHNRSKDVNLKFRLLPMIHLGDKEYYQEILRLANECDEVLFEMAGGPEMNDQDQEVTSMYSPVARKLNLQIQENCIKARDFNTDLIHADYDDVEEANASAILGIFGVIYLYVIIPILIYFTKFFITREKMAKVLGIQHTRINLSFSRVVLQQEERESDFEEGSINHYLFEGREDLVIKTLKERHLLEQDSSKTIGIMYGAGHMKTYARYLIDALNYTTHKGTFVKVFDI